MKYVIDTHALIWFFEGDLRLGTNAKIISMAQDSQLVLPAIALAEAVWIVERGKISISLPEVVIQAVSSDDRVTVYPLNEAVIEQSTRLLEIREMHDRQIIATALVLQSQGEEVALLTCDQAIADSGLVSIVW